MNSDYDRLIAQTYRDLLPMREAEHLRRLAGADMFDDARRHLGLIDPFSNLATQFSAKTLVSDLIQQPVDDALAAFKQLQAKTLNDLRDQVLGVMAPMSPAQVAHKFAMDIAGSLAMKQSSAAEMLESMRAKTLKETLEQIERPFERVIADARAALMPMSLAQYQSMVGALSQVAQESDFEVDPEEIKAFGSDTALQQQAEAAVAGIAARLAGGEKTLGQMTELEFLALFKTAHDQNKESLVSKIVWLFVIALLVNVLNSVFSFYLQYYGTKHLDAQSSQEATKLVKQAGRDAVADREARRELRFVSTKNLTVRNRAGARASVLGQLQFGQMVRLLDKQGDFSLIAWHSEEDQAQLQGWVFSRYLKRFD